MNPIAHDSETALIQGGLLAPPIACLTFTDDVDADPEIIHHADPALYPTLVQILEQPNTTANGAYDLAVYAAKFPDLLPLVFESLEKGLVHDVLLRQKLMDIGEGCYRIQEVDEGGDEPVYKSVKYGLTDLSFRYFGEYLEKDEFRLQYGKLRHLPLSQWPAGAIFYAKNDAKVTLQVHLAQDNCKLRAPTPMYLVNEAAQCQASFVLQLIAAWGFKTDEVEVVKFLKKIEIEQEERREHLQSAGLVKDDESRTMKIAIDRMRGIMGDRCELTPKGLELYRGWWSQMAKLKKLTDENKIAEKRRLFDMGYVSLKGSVCLESGDEVLLKFARYGQFKTLYSKVSKLKTNGMPVQTSFESLLATGRTSSYSSKLLSNSAAIQNLPRAEGMRECFIPRDKHVLLARDYGMAELVAISQVNYKLFGYSKMKDALNAGMDPHLIFAAKIGNMTYEDALANKKAKEVDDRRQIAKCFHPETEVLTRTGWVRLDQLQSGVEVIGAKLLPNKEVELRWEVPSRLTSRQFTGGLIHLKNEGVDLRVTPDHRMCGWDFKVENRQPRQIGADGRFLKTKIQKRILVPTERKPTDFHNFRYWPNAGYLKDEEGIEVDERLLRLAVVTQADGSFRGKDNDHILSQGLKIRLGFTKDRKIERMRAMLQPYLGQWSERMSSQGATEFLISGQLAADIRALLGPDKTMTWDWLNFSEPLREAILDEARFWDGHQRQTLTCFLYYSTISKNIDILQALASITNRKARAGAQHTIYEKSIGLSIKRQNSTRGGEVEITKEVYDGQVYCLTVPSDAVLVRDRGVSVITHQCYNFGTWGGLGAEKFIVYSKSNYNLVYSPNPDEALAIVKAYKKQWLAQWPEAVEYFAWIGRLSERDPKGLCDIKQFMSNRLRGRVSYTEAANGFMQSLTGDAFKAAMFEVSKRCYVVKSSALYGSRILAPVHDELVVETREETAHEADQELKQVMEATYQLWTPDVLIKTEGVMSRRWRKGAKPVFDSNGRLVPWEPGLV